VVSGGRVFAVDFFGTVSAFDEATGELLWQASAGQLVEASVPAVAGGRVFVGGDSGAVVAFDAATGRRVWTTSLHTERLSAIVVAGEQLFVASTTTLFSLDARSGKQLWAQLAALPYGSPAESDGVVYLATPYAVTAFDAATGTLIWGTSLGGDVYGLTVAGGRVFAPSVPHHLDAIDASDGQVLWAKNYNSNDVLQAPAVAHGRVYSQLPYQALLSIDASTGNDEWRTKADGYYGQSPAEANGVVYSGGHDGVLYVFDERSGKELAALGADSALSPPVIAGGMVFVASSAGTLYAFGLPG
jgi:outer membrane protein assembly factor BamB